MSDKFLSGDTPLFPDGLAFARPTVEDPSPILADLAEVFSSGMLTSGPFGQQLEERVAERFGVEHCVAVSSCTSGLMLLLRILAGESAALPSFTFSATGHAALWNGLEPRFVDCDPDTWCIDPSGVPTADVIIGVHVSGVPCRVEDLEKVAESTGATLIFDAAHGAGSTIDVDGESLPLGRFGLAEVFSLTPTKVLSGAEGGLITTNDADLAEELRIGRNYGNPGSYDTLFPGFNARLSEPHAVVALHSLDHLDERVEARNRLADVYHDHLSSLPGIGFQEVPAGSRSSYKDFTITIDAEQFGRDRNEVGDILAREGVDTRKYYDPPLHRQTAYAQWEDTTPTLPVTDSLADRVLTLPMWSHLDEESVEKVCSVLEAIHQRQSR